MYSYIQALIVLKNKELAYYDYYGLPPPGDQPIEVLRVPSLAKKLTLFYEYTAFIKRVSPRKLWKMPRNWRKIQSEFKH